MEKNQKKPKKSNKRPEITSHNGLEISYEKNELKKYFPHLFSEISNKEKSLKINSVNLNIDKNNTDIINNKTEIYKEDLKNPGVLDFLRRCIDKKEAFEILDYLLKRNEIDHEYYNTLKNLIQQEGGLENLIENCGGLKKPGYYERKYYSKKNLTEK